MYKISFIGESRTGTKTSLINRLMGKEFNSDLERTVTASYDTKKIDLWQNKKTGFELWDTPVLNKIKALCKIIIHNSDCVVIGYEINNKKSFEEAKNFSKRIWRR